MPVMARKKWPPSVFEQESLSFQEQFVQNYYTSSDPTARQAAAKLLISKCDDTKRLVSFDIFLHLIKDENALTQYAAWSSLYKCMSSVTLSEILQILEIITTQFGEANSEFQALYVQCLQALPYSGETPQEELRAVVEKILHFISNSLSHAKLARSSLEHILTLVKRPPKFLSKLSTSMSKGRKRKDSVVPIITLGIEKEIRNITDFFISKFGNFKVGDVLPSLI
jgi:hypothetical protein